MLHHINHQCQNDITSFLTSPSPNAASTPSERLFSDVENLLTVKRTRMKPELFSHVMFLKRNSHHFANIHPPAQQVTATPIDV
ncbi:unnamed protein product [Rhizophagus irregularis]|uniref:HAT C-terminal dimerisation domain-containing protein n=1 Tax=Rhizophagus irregularis TaxID=588596 RepID=A0A915ZLG3_9GLOM|nr:unnamed protein product [Rhizophagus irregularis]